MSTFKGDDISNSSAVSGSFNLPYIYYQTYFNELIFLQDKIEPNL